jgi:hypothetical protein
MVHDPLHLPRHEGRRCRHAGPHTQVKRRRCLTGATCRPPPKALPDLPANDQPTVDLPPTPTRTPLTARKSPPPWEEGARRRGSEHEHRRSPNPPAHRTGHPRPDPATTPEGSTAWAADTPSGGRSARHRTPPVRCPFKPPQWPPSPTLARSMTSVACATRRSSPPSPSSHPRTTVRRSGGGAPRKESPAATVLAHRPSCAGE